MLLRYGSRKIMTHTHERSLTASVEIEVYSMSKFSKAHNSEKIASSGKMVRMEQTSQYCCRVTKKVILGR